MGAVGDLVVRLLGDTKQLDDSIRKSEKNLRKFGESAAKIGRKLTTFVTLPILGIGAAFVKVAADAEETNSKFDAVFKKQAESVREWARAWGDATGRSTIKTIEMLASVQDLFVPLGVAREKATDLSKSVVTLATDISSFNNQPTERVLLDIQSALVGSVIPMRKYGVVLNEARVNQELLNMGIAGGNKEATAAEKALARLNIIMASTVDAQGDAVRTAGSFTNKFIALKSSVTDLAETFGTLMLPALQKIVESLTKAIRFVRDLDEEQQKLIIRIALLAAAVGPLLLIISKSITMFIALRKVVLAARTAILLMNLAMAANPGVGLALIIGGLVAAIVLLNVAIGDLNALSKKEKELDEEIIELKKALTTARKEERVEILNTLLAKAAERIATLEALKAEDELRAKMQRSMPFFNEFLADTNRKLSEAKTAYFVLQQQIRSMFEEEEEGKKLLKKTTDAIDEQKDSVVGIGQSFGEVLAPQLNMVMSIMGTELLPLLAAMSVQTTKQGEALGSTSRWIKEYTKQITKQGEALGSTLDWIEKYTKETSKQGEALRSTSDWIKKYTKQTEIEYVPSLLTATEKLMRLNGITIDYKSSVELEMEAEKKRQETLEKTIEIFKRVSDAIVSTTTAIVGSISTIWTNYYAELSQAEDDRLQELQDNLDAGLISEDEFLEGKKAIDQEKRKLVHNEAIRQRDLALFGAVITGAQAIVSGFASLPFLPVGLAMGALAAVLTGFQIAAIASTPIPALAQGGIIREPTVILAGEAGPEIIAPLDSMPMHVTVQLGSNVLFDEITQGTRDRNILIDQGAIA